MIRRLFWVAAAVLLLVVGVSVIRRLTRTEEDRVRSVIDTLVSALETPHLLFTQMRLADNLSKDYRHRGEKVNVVIDREWAIAYVLNLKQRSDLTDFRVEIRETRIDVAPDAETARVVLTGRVTAARRRRPAERIEVLTQPGRNRALVDLRKEDGEWKVVGSERVRSEPLSDAKR